MKLEFQDLRDWLSIVNDKGQLREAQGISLDDVGRIAELSARTPTGPTLLLGGFDGYEAGRRILLNPYGAPSQVATTFGMPETRSSIELLEHFKERLKNVEFIPPSVEGDGPILQNVLEGEEIDLTALPVPKWHEGDGGRYIGTGCLVITRDPEEGWVNVAAYRVQMHSKNEVTWYVSPGHHGFIHRNKYFERGERCPVVVVFGSDPLLFGAAMSELPWGVSELDWVGGWREAPVPVVEGPHTGLPIPAGAEIAIEGFVDSESKRHEGPFGEWTGYYASAFREEPIIDICALYHRDDPILLGIPPEKPPFDADKGRQYIKSALLTNQLREQGIPGIANAWCYGVGGGRLLIAVAIKQQYSGHSSQVGHAAYASPYGNYLGRYVVVVDEDVDVTDLQDLVWAILTRTDPATSIDFINKATSSLLDPMISPEARALGKLYNSRAIIDATRPYEWKEEFPKPVGSPIEELEETKRLYGYLFE